MCNTGCLFIRNTALHKGSDKRKTDTDSMSHVLQAHVTFCVTPVTYTLTTKMPTFFYRCVSGMPFFQQKEKEDPEDATENHGNRLQTRNRFWLPRSRTILRKEHMHLHDNPRSTNERRVFVTASLQVILGFLPLTYPNGTVTRGWNMEVRKINACLAVVSGQKDRINELPASLDGKNAQSQSELNLIS